MKEEVVYFRIRRDRKE